MLQYLPRISRFCLWPTCFSVQVQFTVCAYYVFAKMECATPCHWPDALLRSVPIAILGRALCVVLYDDRCMARAGCTRVVSAKDVARSVQRSVNHSLTTYFFVVCCVVTGDTTGQWGEDESMTHHRFQRCSGVRPSHCTTGRPWLSNEYRYENPTHKCVADTPNATRHCAELAPKSRSGPSTNGRFDWAYSQMYKNIAYGCRGKHCDICNVLYA